MVDMIRNWLLGIVKQAIREVDAESNSRRSIVSIEDMTKSHLGKAVEAHEVIRGLDSTFKRAVPRYPSEPMGFEQEQDAALKAQDSYWMKKNGPDA